MQSWIAINSDIIQGQCKYEKPEEDIKQNTKTFVMCHAERIFIAQLSDHHLSRHYHNRPSDTNNEQRRRRRREHEVIDRYSDFLHVGCNLYNLIYLAEVPIKGNKATSQRQTFLLVSRKKKLFLPCKREKTISRVISGFSLEVDEICTLLGYYVAHSAKSLRRFGTTYGFHLQESRIPMKIQGILGILDP